MDFDSTTLQFTIKDFIQIVGFIIALVSLYWKLKNSISALSQEIQAMRNDQSKTDNKAESNNKKLQDHSRRFSEGDVRLSVLETKLDNQAITLKNMDAKLDRLVENKRTHDD